MIISLIQALYDPRIPIPQDPKIYETIIEDIEFFSISSQIYFLLKQQGKMGDTPTFFQDRLKRSYDESLYLNLFIRNQTEQIYRRFEAEGIPLIPLKGTNFAEKYFGYIGARGTSDIDLLVRREDVEAAIECVKSMGYAIEQERIPGHFHLSFSKSLPLSTVPLTVELHWDLLVEGTSDLNIEEFWNQALPLNPFRYVRELSDYHTFYMICLHGWRHNMSSLKYFIDIIQMIHIVKNKFHYAFLLKNAASHGTLKRISRTLAIVYHYFPHLELIKELPLPKNTRLWWDYKTIRNNNERYLGDYANWIYYHIFDFDTVNQAFTAMYNALRKNC